MSDQPATLASTWPRTVPCPKAIDAGSLDVRFDAPRRCIDVVDALSLARGMKRNDLLVEIIERWTEQTLREVTAVMRVTAMQPPER